MPCVTAQSYSVGMGIEQSRDRTRSQASFFISKFYVFSGWDASDLVLFDDVSYTQLNQSNSLALTSYLERSSFIYLRAAPNLQNL